MNNIFEQKWVKVLAWSILGLSAIFLTFRIGVSVGYKKANYSFKWGEQYHQNFAGPRRGFFDRTMGGMMEVFDDRDFTDAHGVFGRILDIDESFLVIRGADNIEKTIFVASSVPVLRFREVLPLTEIKVDDQVVVIGAPSSSGQIEARFIRLFP